MKGKVALAIAALAAIGGVALLARRASTSERDLWTPESSHNLTEKEADERGTAAQSAIKEE